MSRIDCLIVGGGLAGGLLAWRLAGLRPDLSIRLLEAGPTPGGNHTWSFHDGDLTAAERAWVAPLVAHRWPAYDIRFPGRRRTIGTGYASITSDRFAEQLMQRAGASILTGQPVAQIAPDHALLADGTRVDASAVVDARGFRPSRHLDLGFQKFLGVELSLAQAVAPERPIIMDATVSQDDGYRFVYTLPFAPDRLLIEDTFYADGPALDIDRLRRGIDAYANVQGWPIHGTLRQESGVLPIALDGDIDAFLAEAGAVPAIGLRAGLFHPTTGYSLPDAVRTADLIAAAPQMTTAALAPMLAAHIRAAWRGNAYFRLLNRLLFRGAAADERRAILEHFHRLPEDVIARFYAGRLSTVDKLRIFYGKPPIPVIKALSVIFSSRRVRDVN